MGAGASSGGGRAAAARAGARRRWCSGSGLSVQRWRAAGSCSRAVRQGCAAEPCSLPASLLRRPRSCSRSSQHRHLALGGAVSSPRLVRWLSLRGIAACAAAGHPVPYVRWPRVAPCPCAQRHGRCLSLSLLQRFFPHHECCTFRTARRPILAATCVACMSTGRPRLPQAPTPYPHPAPGWVV